MYLEVDELTQPAFTAAGCEPFIYTSKGKPVPMSYWNVPEDAPDPADAMQPWARPAIEAALRKPAAKASRRRR